MTANSSPRPITVGLLWHSLSSDNFGVGALTESQLSICESAARRLGAQLEYVIFGTTGNRDYAPRNLRIRQGATIPTKRLILGNTPYQKDLDACDVVFDIGEGDSFSDIYGWRRFSFLISSKVGVIAKRIPLILSPQTIGPFSGWWARTIATLVMRGCEKVIARDGQSAAYLHSLGVKRNAEEYVDVAFRLPFTRPEPRADGKVHIGLNVSGLLFAGGYEGTNQFGLTLDYPALMRGLLQEWTRNPDYVVWLIPHVIADDLPKDDDRVAIAQLMQEFPGVQRAPDFASPSEAKSFIAGMDFVTAARMHACIAAFSAGVPVVPLAYSRKFNGLFQTLNYPWVADGKALDTEAARSRILEGFARRSELAAAEVEGNRIAAERLQRYEDIVLNTFRKVSEKRK